MLFSQTRQQHNYDKDTARFTHRQNRTKHVFFCSPFFHCVNFDARQTRTKAAFYFTFNFW